MALFGLTPDVMRPAALTLNILVASLAAYRYTVSGQNDLRLLFPFVVTSIPAAFAGGLLIVPPLIYRPLVGAVLLVAATQFIRTARAAVEGDSLTKTPNVPISLGACDGLGLLAGITGTGGGIFLSPLLLFMHWTDTRRASGVAATFILVNSIAGLAGTSFTLQTLPAALPLWSVAALAGGLLGTWLGTKMLPVPGLRYVLGAVLIIASAKMLLT